MAAVLNSKVTVILEGKPKSLSTVEAALMRLKEKALKGEQRALERLLAYAQGFLTPTTPACVSDI